MLSTAIWLLLIAQSFARDLGPHAHHRNIISGSEAPIEYYDSINLPNPHFKINYIYEQRRREFEDPKIEEIEEEIGKYMHYKISTTTTTTEAVPKVEPEDINDNLKDVNQGAFETPIVVLENHQENLKEATSTLAPIPPAPELRAPIRAHLSRKTSLSPRVSQWEELKEAPKISSAGSHLDRPNFLSYEPHPHRRHPHRRLHISPTTTTSEAPIKIEAQTNHASTEKHVYLSPTTHRPSFKHQNAHNTLAKVRPILDNIKHDAFRHSPRPVYRGSYKFSMDDINDMHTSNMPKVSQLKENPAPPPVPTLSPWYDGYGK